MNVKKVLTVLLAVFLLCAVCCGAVSAFKVNSEAVVTPTGTLVPGDHVTGTVQIMFPKETITDADTMHLITDLTAPTWTVIVSRGANSVTKTYTSADSAVSGFDLSSGTSDVVVDISLEGYVSSNSGGSDINAIKITATNTDSYKSSYTSPAQKVFSPATITTRVNDLNTGIQNLDTRLILYIDAGCDVSDAQRYLEQARSDCRAAEAAGISDAKTAFAKIENAESNLKTAEKTLAGISLGLTNYYLTETYPIIEALYAKGWNSEAMLLETSYLNLQNTYKQLLSTYQANNTPNAAELDDLASGARSLYNDAVAFGEASANPLGGFGAVLNFLPFILIGLGVIAIIIVVIVVILRKRKNSWDELG